MSRDLFDDTGSNIVHFPPGVRPAPDADPERKLTGGMVLAGLIAFFGVIFAVNGVLVHEALSTFSGLDTDSAYHAGQTFERDAAMAKAQDDRHWQVDAALLPASAGATLIDIHARDAAGAPLSGVDASITLQRPTDRRFDHSRRRPPRCAGTFPRQRRQCAGRPVGPRHRADAPGRTTIPLRQPRRAALGFRERRRGERQGRWRKRSIFPCSSSRATPAPRA